MRARVSLPMEDGARREAHTPTDPQAGATGPRDAAPGQALGPSGRYQLASLLGRGGFGAVYRARDVVLERDVAVKVLDTLAPRQPEFLERFRREARVLAQLEHEHILPVYDFGDEAGGLLYVVMRLVEGGSLRDRLMQAPGAPWPLPAAIQLAAQVLDALDTAHERGIVHRDVKPENILLRSARLSAGGEWTYLADFGLAKLLVGEADTGQAATLTRSGTYMGTAAYMAPEQARGQAVDGRADLYAFGVVLYELLTGQAPYRGETPWEVLVQHLQAPLPPARTWNPALPPGVDDVLTTALAKRREDRFATGAAFLAALTTAATSAATGTPAAWSAAGGDVTSATSFQGSEILATPEAPGASESVDASYAPTMRPALTPEALERARQQWDLDALYGRAMRHLAFKEWSEALSQLEELERRQPGYRDAETLLARVQHEMAAEEAARAAQRAAPAPRSPATAGDTAPGVASAALAVLGWALVWALAWLLVMRVAHLRLDSARPPLPALAALGLVTGLAGVAVYDGLLRRNPGAAVRRGLFWGAFWASFWPVVSPAAEAIGPRVIPNAQALTEQALALRIAAYLAAWAAAGAIAGVWLQRRRALRWTGRAAADRL